MLLSGDPQTEGIVDILTTYDLQKQTMIIIDMVSTIIAIKLNNFNYNS